MPVELCPCGCVSREGDAYSWLIDPPIPPAQADDHWAHCYPPSHYEALEEGGA